MHEKHCRREERDFTDTRLHRYNCSTTNRAESADSAYENSCMRATAWTAAARAQVAISHSRYAQIQQLTREPSHKQPVRLANLSERVALWDMLLNTTHTMQRRNEPERLLARSADGSKVAKARTIHVVISIIDDHVPQFASDWSRGTSPRYPHVKLIIYNKTRSVASEEIVHVGEGYERHDVPFTNRTRNCATYVRYVDAFYDRLPDFVLLLKTNQVLPGVVAFLINNAKSLAHELDSHPWYRIAPRTLLVVRCDPRWEELTPLYSVLCPCANEQLHFLVSKITHHIYCLRSSGAVHPRTGKQRPLVEEIFSEGLFGFSRRILQQQPRNVYRDWRRELDTNGEPHQECLDEWITMFDEPWDAPWGRESASGVPVWKASPSRLRYPGFLLH